ncbi:MAG: Bug family tripartite tricarboxylate transporter substrate binding protein [Burkholderiales bacterium]|jgi:tripartite-type tricarboxylate transporter receptor subunit TctC
MDRRTMLAAGAALLAGSPAGVRANEPNWPSRPITFVVPISAGSPTDVMARAVAQDLSPKLGQPIVVDNKPGGGGLIATTAVQQAKPDGHTFLFTISSHSINPAVRKQVRYDPIRDFTPIGLIGAVPHVLVVGPHVPAQDLAALVALARSKPDRLSYGSAGIGISNHMEGELFASMIGARMVHVPYKGGSSEARADLFAGRIDMLFDVLANAAPFVREGRLKAMGVAQARRSRLAPEIPTLAESGLPGFDVMPWTGLLGPAGVDPAIARRLGRVLVDTVTEPKMVERLATTGIEAIGQTPEQFAAFLQRDVAQWNEVARKARIEID